jgi:hypothetical protein
MSLIANERTKLLANALDRASTACVAVGILAPLSGLPYGTGMSREAVPLIYLLIGSICWFAGAVASHVMVRRVLAGLKV